MEMGGRIITFGVVLVLLAIGIVCNAQALNEDGLVAEWHFDEGSGNIVHDSSGNGNDGVIHGATWVDGKFGKALSFDGVDDYVEVPDDTILETNGEKTIELWAKPADDTTGNVPISKYQSDTPTEDGWIIVFDHNKNIRAWIKSVGDKWEAPNVFYNVNQWYHVGMTWNTNGGTVKLYINGEYIGESGTISGLFQGNTKNVIIGNSYNVAGALSAYNWFHGIIDEVCIYNRALTAEEIKAHYEGRRTALTITKTASPHSIKQGQTVTVTISIKNTGRTEIKDIEVADTIPHDLILISGETSKRYASLKPKESREFQYVLQTKEAGTLYLEPATATYADEKGDYYTAKSNTAKIEIIPALITTPIPTLTKAPTTASVHLYGEKTNVVLGEDILLRLSAVNLIIKPPMTVQCIIIPPSGMSVTSAEFTKTAAGQYTTTFKLEPGDGKDIEVRIKPNQVGDFVVEGRVVYYFGDDKTTGEDYTLTLPIKVRSIEPTPKPTQGAEVSQKPGVPGFEAIFAITALLAVAYLVGRKK